ncbi:hypothetical protein C8Q80DRAFT_1120131 [Daedaleopsis nitida]|nr:hypothetical protein C8Q80DRAFT_1120131 [Daedaleopsis nitida]
MMEAVLEFNQKIEYLEEELRARQGLSDCQRILSLGSNGSPITISTPTQVPRECHRGMLYSYTALTSAQSTGEDWSDTILTLRSTADSQASANLSVSAIAPRKVSTVQLASSTPAPAPARRVRHTPYWCSTTSRIAWEELVSWEHVGAKSINGATVDQCPLYLAYRVEGTMTLPSDGLAHKVAIAQLDFFATLKCTCVPHKTTSVFIDSEGTKLVVHDALPLRSGDGNIKVMLRKPNGLAQATDGDVLGEGVKVSRVSIPRTRTKTSNYAWNISYTNIRLFAMRTHNVISVQTSDHPIKSVTIFQSSTAELSRSFAIALKSGRNVVEITGISSNIDTESPRIHGLGNVARVSDVCCHTRSTNSHKIHGDNADVIEGLRKKKRHLGVERQRQRILEESVGAHALTAGADFETLLNRVAARKGAAMGNLIELDEKISKLEDEIALLGRKHQGEANTVVSATILTEIDCEVTLQLTYLVTGATWRPYYDLRASTKDGKPSSDVLLHYCANISQKTGEDWNDAALILSTATSQTLQSFSVPTVESLKVMVTSPPSQRYRSRSPARLPRYRDYHARSSSPLSIRSPRPRYPFTRTPSPPRVPTPPPLAAAVDSRNPLSLTFRVGDLVSLPSEDGKVRWSKVVDGKGGEKDGMYGWVCGVPAGKKIELEAEWDIKAAANVRWEEVIRFK